MFWLARLIKLERPMPPTPTAAMFNVSLGGVNPRPRTLLGTMVNAAPPAATLVRNVRREIAFFLVIDIPPCRDCCVPATIQVSGETLSASYPAGAFDEQQTLGVDASVEVCCLDLAAPLDLDEQTVITGFGKTIGEGNLSWQGGVMHSGHRTHRGVAAVLLPFQEHQRSHGHGACRVHVRKNGQITLDDDQMPSHAHVRFEVRGGLAVFVEDAKVQKDRPLRVQRLTTKIPLPTAAIGQCC